jgi:hypothetical protein
MQSGAGCNTADRTEIKIKKWRQHLKIFLPSAILILAKAYPNIVL